MDSYADVLDFCMTFYGPSLGFHLLLYAVVWPTGGWWRWFSPFSTKRKS